MFSQYRTAIESWTVVGLVLALVIGTQAYQTRHPLAPTDGARVTALLGNTRKAIAAGEFHGGEISAVMGRAELDLRSTSLNAGDEMVLDVLAFWGAVAIRVPDGWTIDTRAVSVAGSVKDRRLRPFDALDQPVSTPEPAPRLVLRGAVVMGGLVIES